MSWELARSAGTGRLLRTILVNRDELGQLIAKAVSDRPSPTRAAAGAPGNLGGPVPAVMRTPQSRDRGAARGASHSRSDRAPADPVQSIRRQVIVEHVRETGRQLNSDTREVLATIDILLRAYEGASGDAGHDAPGAGAAGPCTQPCPCAEPCQEAGRKRAEFIRDLLWAKLDPSMLMSAAQAHGIDSNREYLTLRAHAAAGQGLGELAIELGFQCGRSEGGGLGAVVNGHLVGFLTSPPQGRVRGIAGLGPARPLAELHRSFRMATRALHTTAHCGLTGVYKFTDLGLLPAILSDKAMGEVLCRRYLTPLGDTEFATEIIETLRVYLSFGMHTPQTAQLLCVHPNTVRYRIAKFEELTGVRFRSSRTVAFEVLWALEHRAVHGDPGTASGASA